MGDQKDLGRQKAIEKLKEIADGQFCLFCTYKDSTNITTRPMDTQSVDDEGVLWFLSDKRSHKNREIQDNDKVYLMYSNPGKQEYLSIEGTASISQDRDKIEEMWEPLAKTWFHGGKDDPNLTLIAVHPNEGYYWDTKHGKMIAFVKMVAGAITAKEIDDAVEGHLHL